MNIDLMIIKTKFLLAEYEHMATFKTAKTDLDMLVSKTIFAEKCVQLLQDIFKANEQDKRNDVAI